MRGGHQRADSAQQNQGLDVYRSVVETVEDLTAGIIGGNRLNITANRLARRIHARDDGELRIRGEHHHRQHQNSLRNNRAVMGPCDDHNGQKDQPAEQADPMKPHQRTADDQTSGVHARGRSGKERRKLAECDGGKNSAKKDQRPQPKAKRKVHQSVKECSHVEYQTIPCYMGDRPVSRSIRRAIGGCVENRLAKLAPLRKGATINRCAVDGEASIGSRLE